MEFNLQLLEIAKIAVCFTKMRGEINTQASKSQSTANRGTSFALGAYCAHGASGD